MRDLRFDATCISSFFYQMPKMQNFFWKLCLDRSKWAWTKRFKNDQEASWLKTEDLSFLVRFFFFTSFFTFILKNKCNTSTNQNLHIKSPASPFFFFSSKTLSCFLKKLDQVKPYRSLSPSFLVFNTQDSDKHPL